jgi:O-antigen/teichoic acid export membrane protein
MPRRCGCCETVRVASQQRGIASRTLRGMIWAYGSYVGGRLLVLVSIAILARLLTPAQFGLVAFALIVTALLDTIADLGVSQALIVVKGNELGTKAHTAWTLGVIIGAGLTAITAALGPAAAAFFDQPELALMLPILGLNFLLRSLGVTHFALAQKQLDFRTRTLAEMSDVLVRGSIGIGLALSGAGAYSLVIGYLAGSFAMTVALWLLVDFRPRPRLHRADLSGLLRFGGGLTALNIISAVISQIDYILIGKVLGATSLGLYTLGFRLPELIIINLSFVAGLVLFPAFAEIARPALAAAYLTSLRYVLMVCVPAAVALALLAEPLVLIAFGDQWTGSIAVMQVLTLFAVAITVGIPAGTAYKSIGRIDILVKLAIPRALLAVASILIFVDEGIVAVAACQAGVAVLFSLINIGLASRMLSTGARRIWAVVWPALAGGAAMAVIIELAVLAVDGSVATVAVAAPAGVAAYVGTLWLVAPDALRTLWRTAFSGRAAGAPEPGPT